MNLVLQPCSNKVAQQHYQDTIDNKDLMLNDIKDKLGNQDYQNLSDIYGENHIHIWGVTPSSYSKWDRMNVGDIAIFSKQNEIFSYGVVCFKLHNAELAKKLWGKDSDGNTWEYIYFLTEVTNIHISYKDFNKAVGYDERYIIQGFNVLTQEKTDNFLNVYPIQSNTFIQDVKEEEYVEIINNPLLKMDSVDGKVVSSQRREQAFLRRQLFKGKIKDKCAICGETFPVQFLCCSHIKKRCYCTLEEKKDYENIVISMCHFGCDKLYENGYIGVDNGVVKVLKWTNEEFVDDKLKSLENKNVIGYTENNKKYFDEHLRQNS